MNHQILVTGFDPFGGEAVNPSWEAVSRLPDTIGRWQIRKLQIPTVFGRAADTVLEAVQKEKESPAVILCIGQAGGRDAVTPEMAALNLRYASIADNAGNMPQDEPVIPNGPAAFFSTVPVRKIVQAIRESGGSAHVSYTAGTFVCNDLLYTLLHHFDPAKTKVGFVHVPFLEEQAAAMLRKTGRLYPSMPLDAIVSALGAGISALNIE